jgi:hypothetical protein
MTGARLVEQTLNVASDGMSAGRTLPLPVADLTLELALFPFLFLQGKGCFRRSMPGASRMIDYMEHRMQQMFSPFTLYKVYLVHMWQLLMCNRLDSHLPQRTLLKCITKYKKSHPNATTADALTHVMRYLVPRTLEGSPPWYRAQLADLLAMVQKWGMPAQFLTLTAGDKTLNGVQWEEVRSTFCLCLHGTVALSSLLLCLCISLHSTRHLHVLTAAWAAMLPPHVQVKDLEDKLRTFKVDASWMDAPVENAHLFHRRFTKFMSHWITCQPKGLLGRVTHYFVRYEVQGRGSREYRCTSCPCSRLHHRRVLC